MVLDLRLSWINTQLSMIWQKVLTDHIMVQYMDNATFYDVKQLDKRIGDADIRITQELMFCCQRFAGMVRGGGGGGMRISPGGGGGGGGGG